MPILTRKSLLTFSTESTYGTAPSGSYTAIRIRRDPDVVPLVADRLSRELVRPWIGADQQRLINKRVTVGFDVELVGSGTAGTAPAYGPLILACNCNEAVVASTSVTYSLISSGTASVTMRWHADGSRHQLTGARGTWSLMLNAGEYPMIRFEFTGIYSVPTNVSLPTATYTNQADPVEVSATNTATVTVDSVSQCMSEFELTLGNEIQYENLAGCTEQIRIPNRDPQGRIQIESKLPGTQNFYNMATNTALVPMSVVHSAGAGNIVTVTMSNCDIYEPAPLDRNGVQFLNLPFAPISTDGTSEVSLVFT